MTTPTSDRSTFRARPNGVRWPSRLPRWCRGMSMRRPTRRSSARPTWPRRAGPGHRSDPRRWRRQLCQNCHVYERGQPPALALGHAPHAAKRPTRSVATRHHFHLHGWQRDPTQMGPPSTALAGYGLKAVTGGVGGERLFFTNGGPTVAGTNPPLVAVFARALTSTFSHSRGVDIHSRELLERGPRARRARYTVGALAHHYGHYERPARRWP